jgi:anti-sigma B factor antagonist
VNQPRVDSNCAAEFREALLEAVGRGVKRLLIDLSSVSIMDSTGLGALASAVKAIGPEGTVALAGVRQGVAILLKLTRMETVFRVFATEAEAVEALLG